MKVIEGQPSQWSRLARLAGLSQPLSESEILLLADMQHGKKTDGPEVERRNQRLCVDELGT